MPKKKVEKKTIPEKKSPYQVDVLDIEGKAAGKINLPPKIFGAKVNKKLVAQVIRVYLANQRQGTQKTKSRGEINASKAKIYRQKGTGRARHGAKSAPIFVGGGVAHGPRPRDFSLKMPKAMRRAALFAVLTDKLKEKRIVVVKGLEKVKPKTKEMTQILGKLGIAPAGKNLKKQGQKLLIVLPTKLENLDRAARNISSVTLAPASCLNTYLVLDHKKMLFLPESFPVLEKTFLNTKRAVKTKKEEKVKD